MIQIYWADEKDFILDYKNFSNTGNEGGISTYIETGLKQKEVKIIKIRKWETK